MHKLISAMPKGGKRKGAGRPPRDPSAPLSDVITPLAVRLPQEMRTRFREKAERLGMTEADAVRQLIQAWVDEEEAPAAPTSGASGG